jgi:phospholipase/carboxylesterase
LNNPAYAAKREKIGSLDCIVVQPTSVARQDISAVALFCHGFGAGGDDLVGLAGELLQLAVGSGPLMMVFPAAPLSLDEEGMPGGRAWWMLSIHRLISALEEGRYDQVREEVPEGIDEARSQLTQTIELILDQCGLTVDKLLLGGFSQGAMLSVDTALRGLQSPPAQLCLYSGALICEQFWKPHASKLIQTSIFQSHGRFDAILPLQTGKWLRDMLQSAGCSVEFVEFNGPHTIPYEALERTAAMLTALSS